MGRGFCQKQKTKASKLLGAIDGNKKELGISYKELAKKSGINYSTLMHKVQNEETVMKMTLKELLALSKVLEFEDSQKVQIL